MVARNDDALRCGRTGLDGARKDPKALLRRIGSPHHRGPYEVDGDLEALARICTHLIERVEQLERAPAGHVEPRIPVARRAVPAATPVATRTSGSERAAASPQPERAPAPVPRGERGRLPQAGSLAATILGVIDESHAVWWTTGEMVRHLASLGLPQKVNGTTVCVALTRLMNGGHVTRRYRSGSLLEYGVVEA